MAKVKFVYPYDSVTGKIIHKSSESPIHRKKYFRDDQGRVIGESDTESYYIIHPRNYQMNPLQGEQLTNVTIFQQAVAMAKAERANPNRLAYWTQRWRNQLQQGESDAPIVPATQQHKIYRRLDIFIQTVIQRELKAGTWTSTSHIESPINA